MHVLPRVIAALATLLWMSGVEGVGLHIAVGYVCILLAMAVSATVIAAVWAIALHLHDAERGMLIRAVGDLTTPRSPRAARPLRLAR